MNGKRTLNFIETENVDVKQTKTLGSSARVHRVNIRLSRFQRFSDRRLGSSGEPCSGEVPNVGNNPLLYGEYTPRSPGSSGAHNERKGSVPRCWTALVASTCSGNACYCVSTRLCRSCLHLVLQTSDVLNRLPVHVIRVVFHGSLVLGIDRKAGRAVATGWIVLI